MASRTVSAPLAQLPNALTIARLALIPVYVALILTCDNGRSWAAALVFGVAGVTDQIDGYLARRRKQITPFGQFIDPLADKLLTLAALVSLVQMDLAPAWMVAVILGRDFAVTALRSRSYARGVGIPARCASVNGAAN